MTFESDVVPDSGKTCFPTIKRNGEFESDVVPDSGKTHDVFLLSSFCLRVMQFLIVVKLLCFLIRIQKLFESDVVPDSGKTGHSVRYSRGWFESDVVPDSGKTPARGPHVRSRFESDVVPDSGKTTTSRD